MSSLYNSDSTVSTSDTAKRKHYETENVISLPNIHISKTRCPVESNSGSITINSDVSTIITCKSQLPKIATESYGSSKASNFRIVNENDRDVLPSICDQDALINDFDFLSGRLEPWNKEDRVDILLERPDKPKLNYKYKCVKPKFTKPLIKSIPRRITKRMVLEEEEDNEIAQVMDADEADFRILFPRTIKPPTRGHKYTSMYDSTNISFIRLPFIPLSNAGSRPSSLNKNMKQSDASRNNSSARGKALANQPRRLKPAELAALFPKQDQSIYLKRTAKRQGKQPPNTGNPQTPENLVEDSIATIEDSMAAKQGPKGLRHSNYSKRDQIPTRTKEKTPMKVADQPTWKQQQAEAANTIVELRKMFPQILKKAGSVDNNTLCKLNSENRNALRRLRQFAIDQQVKMAIDIFEIKNDNRHEH